MKDGAFPSKVFFSVLVLGADYQIVEIRGRRVGMVLKANVSL